MRPEQKVSHQCQAYISAEMQAFIAEQVLCFLCTVDQHGQCPVNRWGGVADFLVTSPPSDASPGGTIFLPDYAGNGAFEAIGNIPETGQASLVIPNYAAQLALCISGTALKVELDELPAQLMQRCLVLPVVCGRRLQKSSPGDTMEICEPLHKT